MREKKHHCPECQSLTTTRASHGLCSLCQRVPEIRERYDVPYRVGGGACNGIDATDPTMAEVEALIAEQSLSLPEWWSRDCQRLGNRPVLQGGK